MANDDATYRALRADGIDDAFTDCLHTGDDGQRPALRAANLTVTRRGFSMWTSSCTATCVPTSRRTMARTWR